ncbi:MAG: hypothetical protein RLZZ584_3993, partial [Pseudomonadota bacterium]
MQPFTQPTASIRAFGANLTAQPQQATPVDDALLTMKTASARAS